MRVIFYWTVAAFGLVGCAHQAPRPARDKPGPSEPVASEPANSGAPATEASEPGPTFCEGTPGLTATPTPTPIVGPETAPLPRFEAILATVTTDTTAALAKAYPAIGEAPRPNPGRTQAASFKTLAKALALTPPERERIAAQGFMVSERLVYPHFAAALIDLYHRDLPLLVTSDMILHALHASFDEVLIQLEREALIPRLAALLEASHAGLAKLRPPTTEPAGDPTLAGAWEDADVYLAVARSLLTGRPVAPLSTTPAAQQLTADLTAAVTQARGSQDFAGATIDYSQFTLRGHYESHYDLQAYFRAMMWLGRIDFRLLAKPHPNEPWELAPRALETTLLLREALATSGKRDAWDQIDRLVTLLVGEPDYVRIADLDRLVADYFVAPAGAPGAAPSMLVASLAPARQKALVAALAAGTYGGQRIDGHGQASDPGTDTPSELPPSFAFIGQRYVIDSEVTSHLVYDRIVHAGHKVPRRLPDALDIAFALGDDQALTHLGPELATFPYQRELAASRRLIDAAPAHYWTDTLYGGWLAALRTLAAGAADPRLPAVFRSAPWRDKQLATELASWAQLRHDTLLYAKQSYTSTILCDYPTGLVEPYPAFFRALGAWAAHAREVTATVEFSGREALGAFFEHWRATMARLAAMADKALARTPLDDADRKFLRDTLEAHQEGGMHCGPAPFVLSGWYPKLFWHGVGLETFAPTIADVHTNLNADPPLGPPAVRHVATGYIHLAVVTDDACDGACTFVGPVMSFYQVDSVGVERIPDSVWADTLRAGKAPDAPDFTKSYRVGAPARPNAEGLFASPLTPGRQP